MAKNKAKLGGLAPVPLPGTGGAGSKRSARPTASARPPLTDLQFLVRSFLIMVILPPLFYGIYVAFIASDLYASDARFAVRAAREDASTDLLNAITAGSTDSGSSGSSAAPSGSGLGSATGAAASSEMDQNPFVIANFLMSQAYVAELLSKNWLAPRFSRPSINYFSRLSEKPSLEEAWRYWTRHAVAAVDRRSNTVFLKVWAFSPKDAQDTVALMVVRSETLLNEMEGRSRSDVLDRTRAEFKLADREYDKTLHMLSGMREHLSIVDPVQVATAAQDSLVRFEGERIMLERELRVLQKSENSNSPAANALRRRSDSMRSEVDRLRQRMTGYESDIRAAVNALSTFEELDLNKRFAETRLRIASLAYEEAELRSRRHSFFIYPFIDPSLPLLPDDTWRLQQWLLVAGLSFLIWLIVGVGVTLIRESRY